MAFFRYARIVLPAVLIAGLSGCGPVATDTTVPGNAVKTEGKAKSKSRTAASPSKVGAVVKDGKFTFKVTKIANGPKRIGDQYLNKKPQGKYVFVHVTVKNHGDKAQTFFGDAQKLLAGKKEYSADSEAAIYLKGSKSLFEEINPGNSVKGIIVYDVPKAVIPTGIELHDSLWSGGVRVTLK